MGFSGSGGTLQSVEKKLCLYFEIEVVRFGYRTVMCMPFFSPVLARSLVLYVFYVADLRIVAHARAPLIAPACAGH